jgi:hypothetical protein
VARIGWSGLVVAAALTGFGGWFVTAGISSSPSDEQQARVFRGEPSCSAAAASAGVRGVCVSEPMTVDNVELRWRGAMRRRKQYPYVSVLLGDGTVEEEQLDGTDGWRFVQRVRRGAFGHAQSYHGILVRVVSGALVAETTRAPDVAASSDRGIMWIGAGMVVLGLFIAFLSVRRVLFAGMR